MRLTLRTAFLLLIWAPSWAGNLQVTPLKVFFDKETASATIRVRNAGATKTSVQADVKDWFVTEDGRDAYESTEDFIFFPRIFEVEPGEEGLVRIAYRGTPDPSSEKAYRVFLRELPTAGKQAEGVGFLIELSVPVFVRPGVVRADGVLANAKLVGGWVLVHVENRGSGFLVVDTLEASGRDLHGQETFRIIRGGWYVLAGTTRPFSLEVDPQACRRSHTVTVEAVWNGTTHTFEVEVEPDECSSESLTPLPILLERQ